MNKRSESIRHLQSLVHGLSHDAGKRQAAFFALGEEAVDARLGGGLMRGAVHEVMAEGAAGHAPALASAFALMLAVRSGDRARPILWVLTDAAVRDAGQVYGPGLVDLGIDPGRILFFHAPDEMAALKVGADLLGCGQAGAAIIEAGAAKRLDLTVSRRLALAAEKSGVTCFVTRSAASAIASAAHSRWSVAAAPSQLLPGQAPGHPALSISLVRHRGGIPPFDCLLEWNHDQATFASPFAAVSARHRPAPLSRDLPAPAPSRPLAA
jgi:protein ImuA